MPESSEPSRAEISLPRFQFSLGWLLIAVTVICVLLALAGTIRGIVEAVFVSLIWCAFPSALVICALYGRRDFQAFSIGALMPWLMRITLGIPPMGGYVAVPVALIIASTICGILAVATRRWVVRRGGT